MKVAIGMSHGHAPKWLQVVINSIKLVKNDVESDIYVAHTWPGHPSIKAITECDLGDGITVIDCKRRLQSHATGLDEILEHIADKGYDYFFTTETDCMACKDGWLDWFVKFMEDSHVGMAGFFWHEGNNHYNINASATIYRMDMLLKYHAEVRANKEGIFWHPRGNRSDTESGMDPTIKDVAGVFSETRGLKEPNEVQKDMILKGVPFAAWFEPGAWLYYRSLSEYGNVAVPVDHVYTQFGPVTSPEATYYGGKEDPYFIHAWGGTRAWDFVKHPVTDGFVLGGAPHWIKREDSMWRRSVPEMYHQLVHDIQVEANIKQKMDENLKVFIPEAL